MNLYLVRHGQTAHNRDGVGLGRQDAPLTKLGQAQASAVGARLAGVKIDRVISSPLLRASTTADALAEGRGLAVEFREALLEMDVGLTEGMPFADVRETFPGFVAAWAGPDVAKARMPGGESLGDLALRLAPFVGELRDAPADGSLVVVAHNFVVKVLLCLFLKVELAAFRSFEIGLASISVLSVRGARVNVVGLNDSCHLGRLNLDPAGGSV